MSTSASAKCVSMYICMTSAYKSACMDLWNLTSNTPLAWSMLRTEKQDLFPCCFCMSSNSSASISLRILWCAQSDLYEIYLGILNEVQQYNSGIAVVVEVSSISIPIKVGEKQNQCNADLTKVMWIRYTVDSHNFPIIFVQHLGGTKFTAASHQCLGHFQARLPNFQTWTLSFLVISEAEDPAQIVLIWE